MRGLGALGAGHGRGGLPAALLGSGRARGGAPAAGGAAPGRWGGSGQSPGVAVGESPGPRVCPVSRCRRARNKDGCEARRGAVGSAGFGGAPPTRSPSRGQLQGGRARGGLGGETGLGGTRRRERGALGGAPGIREAAVISIVSEVEFLRG